MELPIKPRSTDASHKSTPTTRNTFQIIVVIAAVLVIACFISEPQFQSNSGGDKLSPRFLTDGELPVEEPIGVPHASTVLLGIFTSESDDEKIRRTLIRETYLNTTDPRICMLSEFMRQHDESEGALVTCRIPYIFVKGYLSSRPYDHDDAAPLAVDAHYALRPLIGENDIVYLNCAESDHKGKSATYFKWASSLKRKYNIDYVAKARTSTLIDMDLMLDFMNRELPPFPYNRRIYGGATWGSFENSNIYAEGAFYFMSSDLAYFISRDLTAAVRKELSNSEQLQEDRDMGNFVYSHTKPIKFVFLSQNQFWIHPLKTEDEWRNGLARMIHLPFQGANTPVHGLCKQWYDEGKVVLPDGTDIQY